VSPVDAYISTFPEDTQKALRRVRQTIAKALPDAEQVISYRMPAFRQKGRVIIYFAGYKAHIGIYPVHLLLPGMADALAPYLSGKATAKFPLGEALPLTLIAQIAHGLAAAHADLADAKMRKARP
jgi:uncharacterized protein YdhG (YjbR/CyaY superfamily)